MGLASHVMKKIALKDGCRLQSEIFGNVLSLKYAASPALLVARQGIIFLLVLEQTMCASTHTPMSCSTQRCSNPSLKV